VCECGASVCLGCYSLLVCVYCMICEKKERERERVWDRERKRVRREREREREPTSTLPAGSRTPQNMPLWRSTSSSLRGSYAYNMKLDACAFQPGRISRRQLAFHFMFCCVLCMVIGNCTLTVYFTLWQKLDTFQTSFSKFFWTWSLVLGHCILNDLLVQESYDNLICFSRPRRLQTGEELKSQAMY